MPTPRQLPADRLAGLPKLPPEDRFAGLLDGVPRIYRHAKCGVETEMPEEIIRSYLADPWMYNDWVWCCGCDDNIRQQDLTWTETGENLSDYFSRLKADRKVSNRTTLRNLVEILVLVILGAGFGATVSGGGQRHNAFFGALIGLGFGLLLLLARRLGMR